jgi:hypothetical protein
MARGDKERRRNRRARSELDKGLRRGDARRAMQALLELPCEERGVKLSAVAELLVSATSAAQRRGDWSRLAELARGVAAEEGLRHHLEPPQRAQLDWALFWGLAQSRRFAEAAAPLALLSGELAARNPELLAWLRSWIEGEGDAALGPPASIARLASEPGHGSERRGPQRKVACPKVLEEVEPAVFTLAATHAWTGFSRQIEAWWSSGPQEVRGAIARLAAGLAGREVIARARRHSPILEPAALLARAARVARSQCDTDSRFERSAGAPDPTSELSQQVLCGLRLVLARVPATGIEDLSAAGTLAALGLALLEDANGDEDSARLLADVITHLPIQPAACRPVAALLPPLVARFPTPELLAKSARILARASSAQRMPAWLLEAFERVNARDLARWLDRADEQQYNELLDAIESFPLRAAESLFERMWPHANEDLRADIANVIGAMLAAACATERTGPISLGEARAMLERARAGDLPEEVAALAAIMIENPSARGVLAEFLSPLQGVLDSEARELLARWSERALPYSRRLLAFALDHAEDRRESRECLGHALAGIEELEPQLKLLPGVEHDKNLERWLLGEISRRWASDLEALARALRWTLVEGAPRRVSNHFARALLDGAHEHPDQVKSEELESMLQLARRIGARRERESQEAKSGATKSRATRSAATKPEKSRSTSQPSTQQEIPF